MWLEYWGIAIYMMFLVAMGYVWRKLSGSFMKKILFVVLLLICPILGQAVEVRTDKPDAVYDVNSRVTFIVSCPDRNDIEYVLSNDGKDILKKGTIQCKEKTANIEGILEKPGFLLCEVIYTPSGGGEKKTVMAGAAFEPDKIKPADGHMPPDFDDFWQRKKRQLAAIPMNPLLTPEPNEEGLVIYDVNIACLGMPVRGYYTKPVNASKGGCPAIAFFQGAGVSSAGKYWITEYGREGFIAIEINAHGIPNGKPADYYKDLYATTLKGYHYRGREDANTCYFTGMFLRVYRALEFLKTQPEWDGKHLIAYGSSQGGAQSIAAAGLDKDVTFLFANVPGMCDHGGFIRGWPKLVPVEEDGSYDKRILNASRYVDCVNFAQRINIPGFFTVGFVDKVCRPTSIYAMYNTYNGPKEIANYPLMGHRLLAEHKRMAKERILRHIGRALVQP